MEYKQLLLRTSVCAMACDGHIDNREKEELDYIEKESPYFKSEDLNQLLNQLIDECSSDFDQFKSTLFSELQQSNLNIVQELTLLEISLRIIAADMIELPSEKEFIISLRKNLKLDTDIILERFTNVDYLNEKKAEFKDFNKIEIETNKIESKNKRKK